MANPPNIPGFFFDSEKEKYFPIKMKASYDAEQKRKSEELEKKLSNPDENVKVRLSLNEFMQVFSIGTRTPEFDSVLQRIERMRICEINWPEKIKIDADKGIYYRHFYEQGFYTVQHVIPSQSDCERVIKEFKHRCADLLVDFGVVPVKADDEFNRDFVYWFVKGERVNRSFDCGDGEFEEDLDIFLPGNAGSIANRRNDDSGVTSHFKVVSSLIEDSHGYNVIVSDANDSLIFRGERHETEILFTQYFDGKYHKQSKVPKNLDFICRVPELGVAHISKGGLIQISHSNVPSAGLKLKNSSATWLHYFDHHLYVLTYHGDLVRFNLRHLPASQQELFNVKDLSQLPWSRFRFEDLIVEAAKAVLLVGFRGGQDILVINLNNPTKVVRKISLKNKIESFKLSSDYTNLYIHNLIKRS